MLKTNNLIDSLYSNSQKVCQSNTKTCKTQIKRLSAGGNTCSLKQSEKDQSSVCDIRLKSCCYSSIYQTTFGPTIDEIILAILELFKNLYIDDCNINTEEIIKDESQSESESDSSESVEEEIMPQDTHDIPQDVPQDIPQDTPEDVPQDIPQDTPKKESKPIITIKDSPFACGCRSEEEVPEDHPPDFQLQQDKTMSWWEPMKSNKSSICECGLRSGDCVPICDWEIIAQDKLSRCECDLIDPLWNSLLEEQWGHVEPIRSLVCTCNTCRNRMIEY